MSGRGNQLTKQVGEFLVAAELGRRRWLAAVLSGNTPGYDLVATDELSRTVPVQVKATRGRSWQFDMRHFAEMELHGKKQSIARLRRFPRNLVCVLVAIGGEDDWDDYFVLTMRRLQSVVANHHRAYLAKHNGVRPGNPKSTHVALRTKEVERYRECWDAIDRAAG